MRVTLTGIDDTTDLDDLRCLLADFPNVEFGVLFSTKREGQPRYPSHQTRRRLASALGQDHLALHLCGQAARDTMAGSDEWTSSDFAAGFGRIQINGYVPGADMRIGRLSTAVDPTSPGRFRYILQARTEADLVAVARDAETYQCADVLFDPSGGRGIEPFRWPRKPSGVRVGYAGGIGPDNIVVVLRDLAMLAPDWIDMESGVREGEAFSVSRARAVLKRVRLVAVKDRL